MNSLPRWTELLVHPIDGISWRIARDITIWTLDRAIWTIPMNTVVTFASSYILRWNLLSKKATFSIASVLHDYLYATGKVTRAMADEYFRDILIAEGVSKFMAWKAYLGVRAFGWWAWNSYRKGK